MQEMRMEAVIGCRRSPNIGRYQMKKICSANDVTLHASYPIGQFRSCIDTTSSNLSDEDS
jgi:hypothetical protein